MRDTLNFIEKIQGYKFRAIHIMPYHPLLGHIDGLNSIIIK